MDAVGGYDNLKAYLRQYTRAFSKKAREYFLPAPRGILVVGVPGCGKSLMAKIVASLLNVPGLRLDLASMFAGIVGESEARIRAALALADAIAPCVVWVDEIDKALAGSTSSGDLDSGVGKRILGTMLTWQAEHKHDVYMFATANQVQHLPPELLRAGRFDAIFALDLPHQEERMQIFDIHLRKRQRDPKEFDVERLANNSVDFTGSEIEEAVITGMYAAFNEDREVKTKDILAACEATVPLVETMSDQVDAIREWGKKRARPASSKEHTAGDRFRQMSKGVEKDLKG